MRSKDLVALSRGFVYCWTHVSGKKYIGSHNGAHASTYVGSGKLFRLAYDKYPTEFTRCILYVGPDFQKFEEKLLKILLVDVSPRFYNLTTSTANPALRGPNHPLWGTTRIQTPATREKIREAALARSKRTGWTHSNETKEKLRLRALNRPKRVLSEETKKKIGDKNRGRVRTEEERKKMAEARRQVPKVVCPNCYKNVDPAHAALWHFDRCKEKNNATG